MADLDPGGNGVLEPDDTSIIPRARAYGNDRWREVRGLPAAPAAVEADLTDAQRKSFRCLVGIIDTPLTGNEQSDFLLRRNAGRRPPAHGVPHTSRRTSDENRSVRRRRLSCRRGRIPADRRIPFVQGIRSRVTTAAAHVRAAASVGSLVTGAGSEAIQRPSQRILVVPAAAIQAASASSNGNPPTRFAQFRTGRHVR
jgi:hypothetical protein